MSIMICSWKLTAASPAMPKSNAGAGALRMVCRGFINHGSDGMPLSREER